MTAKKWAAPSPGVEASGIHPRRKATMTAGALWMSVMRKGQGTDRTMLHNTLSEKAFLGMNPAAPTWIAMSA